MAHTRGLVSGELGTTLNYARDKERTFEFRFPSFVSFCTYRVVFVVAWKKDLHYRVYYY